MRAIAARAGVSVATVSRALNGQPRTAEATRARIRALAAEMGYAPSVAVSQALRSVRRRGRAPCRYTIACVAAAEQLDAYAAYDAAPPGASMVIPSGWRHILALWRGMTRRAAEVGVNLDFFSLRDAAPERLSSILRARNVEAVIVYMRSVSGHESDSLKRLIARLGGSCCVALGPCDPARVPATIVGVDLFEAGRRSYLEAWRAGYRRIISVHLPGSLDPDHRFDAGIRFAAILGTEDLPLEFISGNELARCFSTAREDFCFIGSLVDGAWGQLAASAPDPSSRPGFVSWHANLPHVTDPCTGIDQRDEEQGRTALDLAIAGLDPAGSARGIAGVECLLHPGWIDGESAPARRNLRLNLLRDIPYPRAGASPWVHVPLRRVATASLSPGAAWLDKMAIPAIPIGRWEFHGILFESQPAGPGAGPGVVLPFSAKHPHERGTALPSRVGIPVRHYAHAVYFLHACGYVGVNAPFASYHIVYRTGGVEAVDLVCAERVPCQMPKPERPRTHANIGDWYAEYHPVSTPQARPVRLLEVESRSGNLAHIYTLEWVNPFPNRMIERIDVCPRTAASGMLALFAVTLAT